MMCKGETQAQKAVRHQKYLLIVFVVAIFLLVLPTCTGGSQLALADSGNWQPLPLLTFSWEGSQLIAITKGPQNSRLVIFSTGHGQWVENYEVAAEFLAPESGVWGDLTSAFWDEEGQRLILGNDHRYWEEPAGTGMPVAYSCTERLNPWEWMLFKCLPTYPPIWERPLDEHPRGSVLRAQPEGDSKLWFVLRDEEQNHYLSKVDSFLPGQQRFTVFGHLEAQVAKDGRFITGAFEATPHLVADIGARSWYVAPQGSFPWPTVVSDWALLPLYSYNYPHPRLGVGNYTILALAASRQTQEMLIVSWEAWARWNVILVSDISDRLPVTNEQVWRLSPEIEEPIKINAADIDTRSILIGTDHGLYHIDRQSGQMTLYTVEDGLPSNEIVAVLTDGSTIWAGSKNQAAFLQLP